MNDELRQVVETIRREIDAAHAETRRHFDIVTEAFRHELRIVAEGVTSLGERIDRLDAHIAQVTNDIETRVTRLEAASTRR